VALAASCYKISHGRRPTLDLSKDEAGEGEMEELILFNALCSYDNCRLIGASVLATRPADLCEDITIPIKVCGFKVRFREDVNAR